ncbi:MAG: hypothetical protein ACD_4C00337G0003 [uncultured bacterium (gcode 4)]|uniref:Uncharacterized protein n=1 Tax=uncultured bacterium (gcode 4) TaxID=1234023 RepID=K2GSL8_9BACT|nr:MAG: hypothetical protein ACD_4C00337G0003 [uncultured bacterium (gcode 4)]
MENISSSIEKLDDTVAQSINSIWKKISKTDLKKWQNLYVIISLMIFAFAILSTVFLYFYNNKIDNNINQSNSLVIEYKDQIQKLKNNSQIMAYNIIKWASSNIEKSIEDSKAQKYLAELNNVSRKYKIDFAWFSYNDLKISTSAIASSTNEKDGIDKVEKFIKDYRDDNKKLFILNPISSINWNSLNRSFEVNFVVNNNL